MAGRTFLVSLHHLMYTSIRAFPSFFVPGPRQSTSDKAPSLQAHPVQSQMKNLQRANLVRFRLGCFVRCDSVIISTFYASKSLQATQHYLISIWSLQLAVQSRKLFFEVQHWLSFVDF
jgi:hypothetical protein